MSKRRPLGGQRALLDAHAVARALCGAVTGRNRVQAPGPGHSAKDRSLSVRLEPNAPDGFLVHSFAGDDPIACKDHVRQALGLPAFSPARHRPRRSQVDSVRDRVGGPRHTPTENRAAKQLSKARHIWNQAVSIAGTPAETYLRVARHYAGDLPSTLRYLKPLDQYPGAMVAAFGMARDDEPGLLAIAPEEIAGIHLTRIRADGTGKAGTESDKIMIGSSAGSPIVLAPPNDLLGVAITEGIEDALSVHEVTGLGAWAAGAANRLPALADAVPDYIDCLTIVADPDEVGRQQARQLEKQLKQRGFEVIVANLEGRTTK